MPVQDGEQRAVVAVPRVAQHPPQQTHVGELCAPLVAAVAFVEDVLGLDVEAELGRSRDAFRDGRVQPMQAIEQQNLILLQLDGFGGGAAAFLEAVDRFLNCFPAEQARQDGR